MPNLELREGKSNLSDAAASQQYAFNYLLMPQAGEWSQLGINDNAYMRLFILGSGRLSPKLNILFVGTREIQPTGVMR